MDKREEIFLNMALDYRGEYNKCKWWQFKKKDKLWRNYQSALELALRYVNKNEEFKLKQL